MKKSRFTDEQIVGFLKQAEAGIAVKELCRANGFSDAAFYKWRAKYGGMQVGEATRLREVEAENAKLQMLLPLLVDAEAEEVALEVDLDQVCQVRLFDCVVQPSLGAGV